MAVFKSPHKPQYESPNSRIRTIRKELVEILSLWFPLHHQTTVHSWNWSFFNYNMVFGYRLHLELQLCLCVHVLCNHHEPTDLNRTFIFMGAWVLYVNSINLYGQMKLHNKSRFWDYELLVFLTQRACVFEKYSKAKIRKFKWPSSSARYIYYYLSPKIGVYMHCSQSLYN